MEVRKISRACPGSVNDPELSHFTSAVVLQRTAKKCTKIYNARAQLLFSLLRLQYTFRSAIFFKFQSFGESTDPNEISNVKQISLKKIKYWQRNSGFKFRPEVKITRLIGIFSAVFSNQFFHLKRTL